MSPPIPAAERRSGQVIQLADYRSAVWITPPALDPPYLPDSIQADALPADVSRAFSAWADGHREIKPSHPGTSPAHVKYMDDLGPWTVEEPTPLARQIALIEMGVTAEALLYGAIVLPLPPARSPLRAAIRRVAARLAR